MIFVDVFCSPSTFEATRAAIAEEISAALRTSVGNVVVRRIVTEPEPSEMEIWVELSSDEQFVRYGPSIAERLTERIRTDLAIDVWVLFRIVPLSQAFLNGLRRARGRVALD